MDPDSTEYFMNGLIDTHYPARPDKYEDMCLYEFVQWIDWRKDNKGKVMYKKYTKPKLPNHKLWNPAKEDQREDYYYSLLLLFVPFRDESQLLLPNETAEQAFQRIASEKGSAHSEKLQRMIEAQATVKRINEARGQNNVTSDDKDKEEDKEEDGPHFQGEPKPDLSDATSLTTPPPDKLDLQTRIDMLNADQRKVFDKLRDNFLHQKKHEDGQCQCEIKPLHMFVSGVGGTGKSFLINVLRDLVADMWPLDKVTCAVSAPTGLAAFNLLGITIYRLLQLPVEHEGKTAGYWSLPKSSQKAMRTNLRHLKLLIIDEVSMVSSLNLAYIHLRLQELFGGDEWFGGRNILFVGDLLQLPPVNGAPTFERLSQKIVHYRLGCATAVNIW